MGDESLLQFLYFEMFILSVTLKLFPNVGMVLILSCDLPKLGRVSYDTDSICQKK